MDQSTYIDFDLFGGIDTSGGFAMLTGADALYNSITEWLVSNQDSYIRNPSTGGVLISQVDKPMTPERADKIKSALIAGFSTEFFPAVSIMDISVTADNETDTWTITIIGYVKDLQLIIQYSNSFRRPS